jgi:hypothetical protein
MTTRNRCHFIGIATPQDDTQKRITFCREAILEDANGVMQGRALAQPADLAVPFLPDLATSVRTIADPVTGQPVTFSGAALALWITQEYDARNLSDITPPADAPQETNP